VARVEVDRGVDGRGAAGGGTQGEGSGGERVVGRNARSLNGLAGAGHVHDDGDRRGERQIERTVGGRPGNGRRNEGEVSGLRGFSIAAEEAVAIVAEQDVDGAPRYIEREIARRVDVGVGFTIGVDGAEHEVEAVAAQYGMA